MSDLSDVSYKPNSGFRHVLTRLPSPCRTAGDGMESTEERSLLLKSRVESIVGSVKLDEAPLSSLLSEKFAKATRISITPKYVESAKKDTMVLGSLKSRSPKFVPYEPYRCAVNPILPTDAKKRKAAAKFLKRLEQGQPVDDPDWTVVEPPPAGGRFPAFNENSEALPEVKEKSKHHLEMDNEVKQLREEKRTLENHLKIQTQVNAELKKLLVASVGEDLEARVRFLTEDKLHLAKTVHRYSEKLSHDHEEREQLAVMCDVWRSKYLASSVMVDELAKWKAILTQNVEEAKVLIQGLLDEYVHMHSEALETYRTLDSLKSVFNPLAADVSLPSTNVVDLCSANLKLSKNLSCYLMGSTETKFASEKTRSLDDMETQTPAEKLAQALVSTRPAVTIPDSKSTRVCGYHFHPNVKFDKITMYCCPHCQGEIQVV